MRGVIHDLDSALASRAVLPKNVRFAVPIKVARTGDAPRCRHGPQTHTTGVGCAVHDPDSALASRAVLPKNVCLTVTVEVALHCPRNRVADRPNIASRYHYIVVPFFVYPGAF